MDEEIDPTTLARRECVRALERQETNDEEVAAIIAYLSHSIAVEVDRLRSPIMAELE